MGHYDLFGPSVFKHDQLVPRSTVSCPSIEPVAEGNPETEAEAPLRDFGMFRLAGEKLAGMRWSSFVYDNFNTRCKVLAVASEACQ